MNPRRTGMMILPAAAVAMALGSLHVLAHAGADRLPQKASGDGALDVALGEAREIVSLALVRKADSYFHGGIEAADPDENHLLGEASVAHSDHGEGRSCGHCGHHHHHGEECEDDGHHEGEDEDEVPVPRGRIDPWRWINDGIRAPNVHRHLQGKDSVELMPWLWASVKANPRNIDAWTTASYVAETALKDDALAMRILDEAEATIPGTVEIPAAKGRLLYRQGRGDVDAAEKQFLEARARADRICGGDRTKLDESQERDDRFAGIFLDAIRRKRAE